METTGGAQRRLRECFAGTDDHGVRRGVGRNRVQRPGGSDSQSATLTRREAPMAVMRAQAGSGGVDDRTGRGRQTTALEEPAVVAAGQEARLLALGAVGDLEAGGRRLRTCLLLQRVAERKPDLAEQGRVEAGKHVGLVLLHVRGPPEQSEAAMLDDLA